ncbi:nitrogen fixation protein NifZ [Agarivorans litoreus]|uniref:nitrogen fixation protein NifZ n=1 Tax=Agarivorans litoreus TaxID=1510455 RepID=UPI001C7D24DB|nr:nitrogen fixation protein NifZ [Agarivorans litoreus]
MNSAKFGYGCKVRVVENIRNDGSFPGCKKGALLVRRGATGYVRQSGYYLQDQIVYQVQFINRGLIIGCKEHELIDAELVWQPNQFEYGDKAALTLSLSQQGEVVAKKGSVVDVLAVRRKPKTDPCYRIQYGELDVEVPERALAALKEEEPAYVG